MKLSDQTIERYRATLASLPVSAHRTQENEHTMHKLAAVYQDGGMECCAIAKIKWWDECGNGHNSFYVEAIDNSNLSQNRLAELGRGTTREMFARHWPDKQHLLKYQGFTPTGPVYYLENGIYLAGNRDHNGHAPGEPSNKQWHIKLPSGAFLRVPDGYSKPKMEVLSVWEKHKHTAQAVADQIAGAYPLLLPNKWSKGKPRELDAARRVTCWAEATDEELSVSEDELAGKLMDRLPGLVARFKADLEAEGFCW